jgi:hypothetical protein
VPIPDENDLAEPGRNRNNEFRKCFEFGILFAHGSDDSNAEDRIFLQIHLFLTSGRMLSDIEPNLENITHRHNAPPPVLPLPVRSATRNCPACWWSGQTEKRLSAAEAAMIVQLTAQTCEAM